MKKPVQEQFLKQNLYLVQQQDNNKFIKNNKH